MPTVSARLSPSSRSDETTATTYQETYTCFQCGWQFISRWPPVSGVSHWQTWIACEKCGYNALAIRWAVEGYSTRNRAPCDPDG